MQARVRQEPGRSRAFLEHVNAAGGVQQMVQAEAVEASRLRRSEAAMSIEVSPNEGNEVRRDGAREVGVGEQYRRSRGT